MSSARAKVNPPENPCARGRLPFCTQPRRASADAWPHEDEDVLQLLPQDGDGWRCSIGWSAGCLTKRSHSVSSSRASCDQRGGWCSFCLACKCFFPVGWCWVRSVCQRCQSQRVHSLLRYSQLQKVSQTSAQKTNKTTQLCHDSCIRT